MTDLEDCEVWNYVHFPELFGRPNAPASMMRTTTRRNALEKLATLAAQTTALQDEEEDVARLCELQRPPVPPGTNGSVGGRDKRLETAAVPMSARELDVLIALCRAAPLVSATKDAASLLAQLSPYVPEAHRQTLKSSSLHQQLPPWETLAYDVTAAVLALGLHHPSLKQQALACIDHTVEVLTDSTESTRWLQLQTDGVTDPDVAEQALPAIQLSASLLGFMGAMAEYVQVWTIEERVSLTKRLRHLLSEKFMVLLEGALSAVRNARATTRSIKEWKRWVRHYAAHARPLGAMLIEHAFMTFVERSVTLLFFGSMIRPNDLLDSLLQGILPTSSYGSSSASDVVGFMAEVIMDEMTLLELDADYLQVSSAWQQRLALDVKAISLRSYLCCSLVDEAVADDELLLAWLRTTAEDQVQMADAGLAHTVLTCMTVLAKASPSTASSLTRSLPRLIVQGKMTPDTAALAGECLASTLARMSQDIVISTLYSLGNILSANAGADKGSGLSPFLDAEASANGNQGPYGSQQPLGSAISLVISDEEESANVCGGVVQAIVSIATACNDAQLTALVISMLVQKIGRINQNVDARIITDMAALGLCGGANELRALLRLYTRMASEATIKHDNLITYAVADARVRLASRIPKGSQLYEVYLTHLLSLCVGMGDTAGEHTVDVNLTAQTIAQLFRPIAVLVSSNAGHQLDLENADELSTLSRNAWFNIVVHGFTLTSSTGKEHARELQTLAQYSLPLVDEDRVDIPESAIDLNTVLRRGANPQHMAEQKTALSMGLPQCEADIRGLTYPECVFLNAALLVSNMRARAGDCTSALPYFMESKVKTTPMGNCMLAIALGNVNTYLMRALAGQHQQFAAPQVALQLATFFEGCCHRISKVQQAAVSSADRIITQIPSALCQKSSLFALLELLTLMWKSCLDAETDEYDWKSTYSSEKGNVAVQLSDNIYYRQTTLANFHQRCKFWVSKAIDAAPLDVKGLLQAYLEDYEDDGAYGHIALGRSFAVEMGSLVPSTDQRLASLDRQKDSGINTASDFIAQYTTRQECRRLGGKVAPDEEWALVEHDGSTRLAAIESAPSATDAEAFELYNLAQRLKAHEAVPFANVRDILRDAAGVLSKSASDATALVPGLVGIPFLIFTKQSINLGVSLWLGVIKENPAMETRILVEIAAGWESTVRLQRGFFHGAFQHQDPFYVKEEFAPSKWPAIIKRQQLAHNLLAPHLRLTQWLSSHFSASHLTSPSVERVYGRLMRTTLFAMKHAVSQPLAREVHFHIILLALKVLLESTRADAVTQWHLKDAIISAGLAWFAMPPRWSFGSNRLQLKAEMKVLEDVLSLLQRSTDVGRAKTLAPLQSKQELLVQLLQHEIGRLMVWIFPLVSDSRGAGRDTAIIPLVGTAWQEDPRIAIQLATRFSNSDRMVRDVRWYLLQDPEKAVNDPAALDVLLRASLPSDVKTQLKYLLYWAPINPMAAVTYFMPAYGNHAFIIQYAMRALESHAVDITFFYVPQIVQTLRYDTLGYVERYIVETGKFSQLFAHQIIWNMKANAFKDEDSQVPDPVKPMLDKVMGSLISSFAAEDKVFYEREFDFFGKVTGISGTLKPLIKRPKPEKKQKIEEELRKIELEVGVYLPSNPDGVVIGIDRKSGKPLQSHAKAPFMATFRIRKDEAETELAESQVLSNGEVAKPQIYEVWQSAIFKVGDDCRQDVLALQLIACFRGIFNSVGLDAYVFPYRVTATAPGCGVIDVLPNSVSRDMLGREAVNGLYEYFVSKYGSEDSIRFQEARSNFVKSMAAYSIISYLLQFKDRHNGNIMVDDAGHILHIDFGFCFDIAPGGVKFERAPFKLSPEMVAVMGGTQSQSYRAFEELAVKAFIASRQYVEQLAHVILTMLDSGLPCFKPTMLQHFKERFVLEKSDREAAEYVRKLVHWSERSHSTGVYDYFQLLTNGIPY
ncbi:Phosphatidylinositol 4-kinase stt4 [Friedmanniomyces endolithicus]|nr:Phosphatidylinositol 4-kinase stt4 [Friedmanniomyces endolithicus]KAK0803493.1 Phosphatidylinositol 4-kinase stt4 [Friedmanniomyces endolithicus]KAK0819185.1 Phosphatidylinositol 4-kinase stt4 [Friedmanniomyces endolithicus]KAK0848081.1 Phosphatidylinositol 4-kinase stt4 [Friedmanniomyces endolithicus]